MQWFEEQCASVTNGHRDVNNNLNLCVPQLGYGQTNRLPSGIRLARPVTSPPKKTLKRFKLLNALDLDSSQTVDNFCSSSKRPKVILYRICMNFEYTLKKSIPQGRFYSFHE